MNELFSVSVNYPGKEYSYEARLATVGYTHKFLVMINGMVLIFEPDWEGLYSKLIPLQ